MSTVTLGKTGIVTDRNGFGALPIQRIPKEDAVKLLRKAYHGGMTFFDTARAYTDSEEKLGCAFEGMRSHIYIATKTAAGNRDEFWKDLETSLTLLKTDYIDIYQFHNPAFCPKPGDESGLYEAALKAKEQGKIRFISITNHRLQVFRLLQKLFCFVHHIGIDKCAIKSGGQRMHPKNKLYLAYMDRVRDDIACVFPEVHRATSLSRLACFLSSSANLWSNCSTVQFFLNLPKELFPNIAVVRLSMSKSRRHNSGWCRRSFRSSPILCSGQHQQEQRL